MPRTSPLGLPPRYRRHALAKLDAVIEGAERERAERLRAVERLAAAEKGTARAKARLRTAEYRLALLRGSRRVLLPDEPPRAGDQPPAAAARSGDPGRNGARRGDARPWTRSAR